jgi:glucuronate isomerase
MRSELSKRLEIEISKMPVIDPHTHLQHRTPSAQFIGNIFSYHYIRMELSTVGMDVEKLMNDSIPPDERMKNAIPFIPKITNTTTWWGFMTISHALGFKGDTVNEDNWYDLCEIASKTMQSEGWYRKALESVNIKKSFLTNLPDEDLSSCDRESFVPSLRTDEWVLDIQEKATREKLELLTGNSILNLIDLKSAIRKVVDKFVGIKAASMAISLPPNFQAFPVADGDARVMMNRHVCNLICSTPFLNSATRLIFHSSLC